MQTSLEKLWDHKLFLFCLLVVGFAVLVSNLLGTQTANVMTDLLYVPVSGGVLILSVIIAVKFRGQSDLGRAYLLFTGFVSFWFVGELVWLRSELVSHLLPFPVETDWMYLAGYPFLLAFMSYYLKPFRLAISKKMLLQASLATVVFLIPSLYTMYSYNPSTSLLDIVWAALYPISDAIVLFPAVLGLSLFIKGKVGLLWSFCCIAIILNIIADSGFFFFDTNNSNSGNPLNILSLWSYILFAFGIYSHVKLYSSPKKKSYGNVEDLK